MIHNSISSNSVLYFSFIVNAVKQDEPDGKRTFNQSLIDVRSIQTIKMKKAANIILQKKACEFWVLHREKKELVQYDDKGNKQITRTLEFNAVDMIWDATSDDIIASDDTNNRLVRIPSAGTINTLFSTCPFTPGGLYQNDKLEIAVGLKTRPSQNTFRLKLAIFSPTDDRPIHEIERNESKQPMFSKSILHVKQNGNGDYLVSDEEKVVCVTREGMFRWQYTITPDNIFVTPVCGVFGIICDQFDNIIIGEWGNNKVVLLDGGGKVLKVLCTEKEGISGPLALTMDKHDVLWIGQHTDIKCMQYLNSNYIYKR